MQKLTTLEISRRVHTPIKVDLTTYVFPAGSKVVWTIKEDEYGEELIKREFTQSGLYQVLISPEEAQKLTKPTYHYSIVQVLADGTRFPQCEISDIKMKGVIYGTKNIN